MYTLIYHNGQFNRPDTLLPFLQANVGKSPQIQIDCIMPYYGTAGQLEDAVCAYLSKLDPQIEVLPNMILNRSSERTETGEVVSYLVMYIDVRNRLIKSKRTTVK
ncbi:MAG: hypothetical protein J6Y78_17080 [Paludibacteraceae bacterium]|nr:hypothetical protein [Paludibacteraceae bacterium]